MIWYLVYCWLFLFLLSNNRIEAKKEDITNADIIDSYSVDIDLDDSYISNSDNSDISNFDIINTDIDSNIE